jgi:Zn-dependent peptidase ImmA (M78 family)/DNA-binding XRE family transcriptional regulator
MGTTKTFQGSRLRLARTFRGLTLAEVGEKISVTRQYIQKIESSDNCSPPSDDLIAALAEIVNVPVGFFFESAPQEVSEEDCFFRKRKTTPQHIQMRAASYGVIFNLILARLEQDIELPPVNISDIAVKSREDIERAAEKCRMAWGLYLDAPIQNVTRVLERAGCVVTTFADVSDKIDAFSYFQDRPVIVRSLDKGSPSRARFDLAHELGHLVMHRNLQPGGPELEDQANNFASAFLLPRIAFLREFPSHRLEWRKILDLKKRWGVSMQAIIRRAYDLNLITAVQYRNAHVHFSRTKQRVHEDGEEFIPVESPEIIIDGLNILYESLSISPSTFLEEIKLNRDVFDKFDIDISNLEVDREKWPSTVVSIDKYRKQAPN